MHKLALAWGALFLIGATLKSSAFALLGPFQPWMQATNGVIMPGDVGGPMEIGNEYRWNVPVVTYGFDKSFLDYFGSNGVAAVTSAIQIINDLPQASDAVLTNYPFQAQRLNPTASAQSLIDLKSETLAALLGQLGLGQPIRYLYDLKQWTTNFIYHGDTLSWLPGTIPEYILELNYDPVTLLATNYINNAVYAGRVYGGSLGFGVAPLAVDPFNTGIPTANFSLGFGYFNTGLTYDDVGGLAYLFSTNNIHYETLLSGITGIGTCPTSLVNGAWRPGVNKITFIPQPLDPITGAFLPATNFFTDNFITNGVLGQQQVARRISQPDFLFGAGDVTVPYPEVFLCSRTGATNWQNNSLSNASTNGGPGVIQPQIGIVFDKIGQNFASVGTIFQESGQALEPNEIPYTTPTNLASPIAASWASFDGTTNAPIIYPIPHAGPSLMTIRMWLWFFGQSQKSFTWTNNSSSGAAFAMQTSGDLVNWTTLFTATNSGGVCTFFNFNPSSAAQFYKIVPQ